MLRTRLVAGIKRRGGSLALSWVNIAEFSKVTDGMQVRAAEDLIEELLPNVHFLEVDPFKVIDREDALLAGGPPAPPHLDPDALKAMTLLKPGSVQPVTARGLFLAVHGKVLPGLTQMADALIGRVASLRDELYRDPSFRASLKAARPRGRGPQATRVIFWEIARALTLDGQKKVTPNDAMDLYHAVVPAAYCDLVLLDKHWKDQIDRCSKRCADAGLAVPIAKVYSKANDGVERFMTELETC